MKVAYADPPYIGQAKRHYNCEEVDYQQLIRGLVGAKPNGFCLWLFSVLNLQADDQFDDIFPGTGAVSRCWEKYRAPIGGKE